MTCYICGQQHFPSECYLAETDDFEPEVPTLPKVGPYKPSDEYLAWCAERRLQAQVERELSFLMRKDAA